MFRLALASVLALSIGAIAFLWSELRRQQDMLVNVRLDNAQWTVGQAMVEYIELVAALEMPQGRGVDAEALAEIRQKFNILYNRIDILRYGRAYAHLLDDPEFAAYLLRVKNALDGRISLIDGRNADLAAALPDMTTEVIALEPEVRGFVAEGVRVFAVKSTEMRLGLTRTMARVAWLTAAMLALLIGLAAILLRERRLAEDRLVAQQRMSARLDTILSTSNDAIVVAGLDGRIVDFNGAAECIFGLAADETIGQSLRRFLQPPEAAGNLRQIVGRGVVEMAAVSARGKAFPAEVTVEAVEIDEGPLLVAFIRDITERKAAETELIEARDRARAGERAKADFVAVMSHELRTPLNGILGMLTLLRDTALGARQRDYVRKMETSGKILLASIDDVLDISRTEAGGIEISPVSTALRPLLQGVADSQSGAATARGNRIRFLARGDLPDRVLVDAGRLRQILVNLIGNSIKFTENGDVSLAARMQRGVGLRSILELRVSDSGSGIEEGDLGRIFEDFETLDPTLARQQSGAGLGLAIVRRLVEAMAGELEVSSVPRHGSTFTVTLPVAPVGVAPSDAETDAGTAPGPASAPALVVLVVEDNDVNRAVLTGLLDRRGCHVVEAGSARDGIDAAARRAFDLILMDLSMPGIDGVEAARRIRSGGGPSAAAPIYAVTAHSALSVDDVDAAAGLNGVLTKPLRPSEIDTLLGQIGRAGGCDGQEPVLDTLHLRQLLSDLGPRKLAGFLDRFAAEAAEETRLLSDAAANGDLPKIAARAHRLCGAAQNYGACRLGARLSSLETAAHAGDRTRAVAVAAGLGADCRAADAALRSWRGEAMTLQTP